MLVEMLPIEDVHPVVFQQKAAFNAFAHLVDVMDERVLRRVRDDLKLSAVLFEKQWPSVIHTLEWDRSFVEQTRF